MTGYLTPEDFNPRSYKRSDYDGYHRALHPQISIHAPTRGATVNPKHYIGCTYFNPRSYKRSDMGNSRTQIVHSISIHAPTRGATWEDDFLWWYIKHISIHAPTRGATDHAIPPESYFRISIHAPTRGATLRSA